MLLLRQGDDHGQRQHSLCELSTASGRGDPLTLYLDAVICCEFSTASGRGEPLTLTLYRVEEAAKEQFTMHFTCRLQNPEVSHSCGGALLAYKSVALHLDIGSNSLPGRSSLAKTASLVAPTAASLPSGKCSGSGWLQSHSSRDSHLRGDGFHKHLSAPTSGKEAHE